MLEELEEIQIENQEKYINLFKELINQVKEDALNRTFFEEQECKLIEFETKGENIIYLVPNPILTLFNKLRKKYVDEYLGFSVLIKDIRVSCFGISCDKLGKTIIN